MRKGLARREGQRLRFRGTFDRYGTKPGWGSHPPVRTLVLVGVVEAATGRLVADHLWFTETVSFRRYSFEPGDVVEFDARVKGYVAGYMGHDYDIRAMTPPRCDYKLAWPTRVVRVALNGGERP